MKKRMLAIIIIIVLISFLLLLFALRIDTIILPSATMMIIGFITSGLGMGRLSGLKPKKSIVKGINLPP